MTTTRELVPVIEGEFRDVAPVVTADEAKAAMQAYQELAQAVTEPSDIQTFREKGKKHEFRKRSGWKKLERFFGISVEIKDERVFHLHDTRVCLRVKMPESFKDVVDCGCPIKGVRYVVRAVDTRTGRFSENVGICTTSESRVPTSASLHDIATRAFNRGANRATADLLGVSDKSADERGAERGVSKEAARALKEKWLAATESGRSAALTAMRALLAADGNKGWAEASEKQVYGGFLVLRTEDDLPEIMDILDPPTAVDPEDMPFGEEGKDAGAATTPKKA